MVCEMHVKIFKEAVCGWWRGGIYSLYGMVWYLYAKFVPEIVFGDDGVVWLGEWVGF